MQIDFRDVYCEDAFSDALNDFLDEKHSEYWFKGGRGSTKSSFISLLIVLGLLNDENANAVIYRRVGNTIKDSVYSQMVWALDMLGLSAYCKFRQSPLEIIFTPAPDRLQRILFRGADDPMKSKSIKLTRGYFKYLWFEELTEYRGMEDVRIIKQSVFRGVKRAVTFYSYNPPKSVQNWVNEESLKPRHDRYVSHSSYLDVIKHHRDWLEEAFISEAEVVRETNERAYRNEYLGEITGTGGQVFDNLQIRPITQQEKQAFGHTYAGLDFGWFPDPLHFTRCAYDPAQRRLWIYDEYRTVKTSNADAYAQLCDLKHLRCDEEVIADSAEMKSVNDMRVYGMNCIAATKGAGSVRASMKWLQSLKKIIIDPIACPETAKEFVEYEYEKTRDGQIADAYPDANNHAIDAVRYALNRVWLRAGA